MTRDEFRKMAARAANGSSSIERQLAASLLVAERDRLAAALERIVEFAATDIRGAGVVLEDVRRLAQKTLVQLVPLKSNPKETE